MRKSVDGREYQESQIIQGSEYLLKHFDYPETQTRHSFPVVDTRPHSPERTCPCQPMQDWTPRLETFLHNGTDWFWITTIHGEQLAVRGEKPTT